MKNTALRLLRRNLNLCNSVAASGHGAGNGMMRAPGPCVGVSRCVLLNRSYSTDAPHLLPSSSDDVYVVSGCARGIGMEFALQLLSRTQGSVVGLCRNPDSSGVAKLIRDYPERFSAIEMDLTDQNSIEEAGRRVAGMHDRVSLLLNVSGVLGDGVNHPGPERKLASIDRSWLHSTLDINLIGHVMVTREMQRLLKGDRKTGKLAKVASLSARVGSIQDNRLGGWYSYRVSKAALNQFTKTVSLELSRQRCVAIALHPGTVDTDLSVPFQKNVSPEKLFSPTRSVSDMLDVVWNCSLEDTGKLYAYDGSIIPW